MGCSEHELMQHKEDLSLPLYTAYKLKNLSLLLSSAIAIISFRFYAI